MHGAVCASAQHGAGASNVEASAARELVWDDGARVLVSALGGEFRCPGGAGLVVAYSIVLVDILLALKPGGATMKPEMVEMARVMGYGNYCVSGTALFPVGVIALGVRLNPQQDIALLTGRSFDVEVAGIVIVTARTRGSPRLAPPVHERDSLVLSSGWGP